MRISTDVATTWKPLFARPAAPSTRNALLSTVARAAMHGKLWLNDPDCAIMRRRADENDLRPTETGTMAALISLSGGMVLSGDNVATLTPARRRLLQRLLPPSNLAATPLDLFERDEPRLFALPMTGAAGPGLIVATVNWEDHPDTIFIAWRQLRPALGEGTMSVWRLADGQRPLLLGSYGRAQQHGDLPPVNLPPHSTALLLLKAETGHPDLLASGFHLLAGMVEVEEVTWQSRRLTITLAKPGRQRGSLWIVVPQGYAPSTVRVNGRRRRYTLEQGLLEVTFTLNDRAVVEVAFG
jgi:alpha-galactosidase